jgi:hypothetical protein
VARTLLLALVSLTFPAGAAAHPGRTLYLGGCLSHEELLTVSSAVAADGESVLLLDSPACAPYLKAFLADYRPDRVVPVGSFPGGADALRHRLDRPTERPVSPGALRDARFPRPARLVVCPAEPRRLLLHAACLAGLVRAPLFITHDEADERDLRRRVEGWGTGEVLAVGRVPDLPGVGVARLGTEKAVAERCLSEQTRRGPVTALVVANPDDLWEDRGGTSSLAPWAAVRRHAALVLTDAEGDAERAVAAALRREPLRAADAVLLLANPRAVPPELRPNPIPADKDPVIEAEPLTPEGDEPFSFALGRLFHDDPAVVALVLARQRLLAEARGPRRALVASNPGGGLPLLEVLSRSTARELSNAGYETTAWFRNEVRVEGLRRRLADCDVFLWEGHHSTLVRDFRFHEWDDCLPPSLVFLQSCLALTDDKAGPLLRRGAVAVIGTSSRTYSASGGACSLAFFNALHYDGRPVGAGLRDAKNFLLAYAQLKEKRLGAEARKGGANLRAAWAFHLWGDPTLTLPRPVPPADALPAVRHEVRGSTVVVSLPGKKYEPVVSPPYRVAMPPNGRLAGLLRLEEDEDDRPLVPLVFAEVPLPKAPEGQRPELHGRLPSSRYVFTWDGRRKCGYLLAAPRSGDRGELRFRVTWAEAGVAATGR